MRVPCRTSASGGARTRRRSRRQDPGHVRGSPTARAVLVFAFMTTGLAWTASWCWGTDGGTLLRRRARAYRRQCRGASGQRDRPGRLSRRRSHRRNSWMEGALEERPGAVRLWPCVPPADDEKVRQAALAALPKVARIGTHLFHFAEYVEGFRGWGRRPREPPAAGTLRCRRTKFGVAGREVPAAQRLVAPRPPAPVASEGRGRREEGGFRLCLAVAFDDRGPGSGSFFFFIRRVRGEPEEHSPAKEGAAVSLIREATGSPTSACRTSGRVTRTCGPPCSRPWASPR